MLVAMPRSTSINIGEHFDRFIGEQLEEGRFASASEVVRAGLRLLEEHEGKVQALRAALIDGEQSGPARRLDRKAFLASVKRKRRHG